jgi:hypothetical protein
MNWPTRALFAVTAAVGTGLHSRAQTQNQPPSSARSRSDENVGWNFDLNGNSLGTCTPTKPTPSILTAGRTKVTLTLSFMTSAATSSKK